MNPYKILRRAYDEFLAVVWDPLDGTKERMEELGRRPYRDIISVLHRNERLKHSEVLASYMSLEDQGSQTVFIEAPVKKLIDEGIIRKPNAGVHSLTWRGRQYARELEL